MNKVRHLLTFVQYRWSPFTCFIKKHLGVYPLIEIYLFINPLDRCSVEAEEALLHFAANSTEKIDLTILPLVNPKIITHALAKQRVTLEERNEYMALAYKTALDFKAAQIQGKKIARSFLFTIQQQLFSTNASYSEQLVQAFFQEHGDYAMFLEDRTSDLVKDLFWNDQRTAQKLQISCSTSAVVYNCMCSGDGLLLEGLETIQEIPHLNYLQDKTAFQGIPLENKAYN